MLRPAPRPRRTLAALVVTCAVAVTAAACASRPEPISVTLYGEARVGRPPVGLFRNANGSPRITRASDRDAYYTRVVPLLERDAVNPQIQVDPNYVTALFIKESALDTLAVSPVAALGIAQLTPRADADMRAITRSPAFASIAAEVNGWPRDPAIHVDTAAPQISADTVRARLARGAITARTEYLFDPALSTRAAEYWLKMLQTKWTSDSWPGGYGTFANEKLNRGRPATADQVFELVTVSYNQGYVWTHDAVNRLGVEWVRRLPELGPAGVEAADYLGRVRAYTNLLARGEIPQQRGQRR